MGSAADIETPAAGKRIPRFSQPVTPCPTLPDVPSVHHIQDIVIIGIVRRDLYSRSQEKQKEAVATKQNAPCISGSPKRARLSSYRQAPRHEKQAWLGHPFFFDNFVPCIGLAG